MTILFGTARAHYPEFGDPQGGIAQIERKATGIIGEVLSQVGARIFNNTFVEDGVQSVPGTAFAGSHYNAINAPNRRAITSQHPNPTVFLKKRMFSTLRQNYNVTFMDEDEKIFLRAIKNIFRRKCDEIALYEHLVVLEKVIEDPSFLTIDTFLDNVLGSLEAAIGLGFGIKNDDVEEFLTNTIGRNSELQSLLDKGFSTFMSSLLSLREVNERAKQNKYTTWIIDPKATDYASIGLGTGCIEFTMMTNLSTSISLNHRQPGKATLTIEDPYRLTRITENDIDIGLKQALQESEGFPAFFDYKGKLLMAKAELLDNELNAMRRARKVSEINFEFPFGSQKNVSATLIEFNIEIDRGNFAEKVSEDPRSLIVHQGIPTNLPAGQELSLPELTRFNNVINLLDEYRSIQDRTVNDLQANNARYAVVRGRLRNEFVGHHIFQQMDGIHIFVNSFTRDETPVYANRPDLLVGNLADAVLGIEEQSGRLSDEILEQERLALAPAIPAYIYKAIRNPLHFRSTGPQIFCGLVESASCQYEAASGRYVLNVSATDNTHYLQMSQISRQPSLTQRLAQIDDPLTPFEITADPATGLVSTKLTLLESNIRRMKQGVIKFDDNPYLGKQVVDEQSIIHNTSQSNQGKIISYRHAPGLTYRWKQGILTVTLQSPITQPLDGSEGSFNNLIEPLELTNITNPFANLDVADIISLLVTGQPHDFNRVLKDGMKSGSLRVDNDLNTGFVTQLGSDVEKRGIMNGNFLSTTTSGIEPGKLASLTTQQKRLTTSISNISIIKSERARLEGNLREAGFNADINSNTDTQIAIQNSLQEQIIALDKQISALEVQLDTIAQTNTDGIQIQVVGSETTLNFSSEDHRALTKKLRYMAKRKPEDVRYNKDRNYFIVSDKYDADTNIKAFTIELLQNGPDLVENTDIKTPYDICLESAGIVNFEFFADSQGNIVFRPPEYNKTPLSLILRMIELGRTDGISLAPQFLINLISSRIDIVAQNILKTDLQILENLLLLGPSNIGNIDIKLALSKNDNGTYDFNAKIALQKNTDNVIFSESTQKILTFDAIKIAKDDQSDRIVALIAIRNELLDRTGISSNKEKRFLSKDNSEDFTDLSNELYSYNGSGNDVFVNRLKATNKIGQLISEHQQLIKTYSKLAETQNQFNTVNNALSPMSSFAVAAKGLSDAFGGADDRPLFPLFFEDLIENDLQNIDGFNSGKRFIIEDKSIVNMNFEIRTPEFNRVAVTGSQNLVNAAVGEQFWAGATDFDSWRQFGYKASVSRQVPLLTNANTQLAPYAQFLLIQQRRKIHSGTITLVGNEYYQPGDVVYVNCRQMLYYVETVSHTLNLGTNSFTTVLSLSYGRAVGEYIPSPLDIIGKTMISNNLNAFSGMVADRSGITASNIVPVATLVIPTTDSNPDSQMRAFIKTNIEKIQQAIVNAKSEIEKTKKGSARIELRSYYIPGAVLLNQIPFMNITRNILNGTITPEIKTEILADLSATFSQTPEQADAFDQHLDSADIDPVNYIIALSKDLSKDDIEYRRIPSRQAWALGSGSNNKSSDGLPTNVIDIVVVTDTNRRGDKPGEDDAKKHTIEAGSADISNNALV